MTRRLAFAAFLLAAPVAAKAQAGAPASSAAPAAQPAAWTFDQPHSQVGFTIRHLISRVRGSFREFTGTLELPDPARWDKASVDVQIRAASIFTDNEKRDNHLRSGDFFLADSFPVIHFRSTRVVRRGNSGKIYGTLTMRGVTKPVVLDATFLGYTRTAQQERIGFEATAEIDRLDYGVAWNRAAEGGGTVLGDDVKIEINIEAVRGR